jgi:serine/threonine protein kinase
VTQESPDHVILADFSLAVPIQTTALDSHGADFDLQVGTVPYRAVEWFCMGHTREAKIDSFSIGMVIFDLYMKVPIIRLPRGVKEAMYYVPGMLLDVLVFGREANLWPKALDGHLRSEAVKLLAAAYWKKFPRNLSENPVHPSLIEAFKVMPPAMFDLFYALSNPDPELRITPVQALEHEAFVSSGAKYGYYEALQELLE